MVASAVKSDRGDALGGLLACPGHPEREAVISKIMADNVRDHLHGFLHRHERTVRGRSSGLVPLIARFMEEAAPADIGPGFPSAAIAASFSDASIDPVVVAAKIAGHYHGCGRRGAWRAEFSRPSAIRFGKYVTAEITAAWVADEFIARNMRSLGCIEVGDVRSPGSPRRQLWIAGPEDRETLALDDAIPFAANALPDRVREVQQAIELMRAHAPEYVDWVSSSVRIVASWQGNGEQTMSGSMPGQHGVIYCASPLSPMRIAESLIHEAAHQHFHVGEMVTAYHTPVDEDGYWSPYVKKNRPIDRILLAFHAFANVAAFYLRVLGTTRDDALRARARAGLEQHYPNLVLFKSYLDRSPGLSPAGRAMQRALEKRIAL